MRGKVLILFIFVTLWCYGQTVPNTNTFSLQDVVNVTGGTNLTDAFTRAIDGKFDPSYAGSKNNLYNFRNYGTYCARPSGLTYYNFYYIVDGVSITSAALAIYYAANFTCGGGCIPRLGQTFSTGQNVYDGTYSPTNCNMVPDGYYVMSLIVSPFTKYAVQVLYSRLYYLPV